MFKIKWQNDVNRYETVYYGFELFHHCNAAIVRHVSDNTDNALGHDVHIEHAALVSYDTPIMIVTYYHDRTTNKDGFNIDVNRSAYRCSNSTIRQVSRFMRETMGDIFTYLELKDFDTRYPMHKDITIATYAPVHVFWMDSCDLRYRIECAFNHAYWCTFVAED